MGLYDSLRCELPLPDGYDRGALAEFQTKDLGCAMATYAITAEHRLVCTEPAGLWPCGLWELAAPGTPLPFHGVLTFYDIDPDTRAWHEYVATFTSGVCASIELAPDTR